MARELPETAGLIQGGPYRKKTKKQKKQITSLQAIRIHCENSHSQTKNLNSQFIY